MAAMDVKETKQFILRQLDDMRRSGAPGPAAEPPPRRPRAPRLRSVNEGPSRGETEARLDQIEERLAAIERCFLSTPATRRRPPTAAGSPPSPDANKPGAAPLKRPEMDFDGMPYRMTGMAGDGLMADVLQMLATNQKSGRFSLIAGGGKHRFHTYFRDGEIVDVEAGNMKGDAAFFAMMATGQEDGYYGFLDEDVSKVTKTIEAKTQFLILEALRRIDEDRNKRAEPQEGKKP